ncbi:MULTISPECIES: iron-containing alcohol dehydrogenase family protein [unclassified Paenibacillus]|uniref:iron-containing alcohol dehydrogenase family protein n=1 Tax=unclassified Paenibacillus TaxID=185978 RepID=UPI001AEB8312|nr:MULTISPECIES: iron-containing alcohol dehydrogenase family protein [unclassified Paenibacillus]MBP1154891.1 glycerol dehydrogenase [Paenibacillus sp. PvP091]MBP1169725.1 glycerol dehydrogenase [Paenibacillus sp. PvR098]MBP2440753.1 glycerol dehydrogenase [Paenibacillus sp. PvP052]
MFRVKAYPTNYIQEPGILRETGEWVKKFGNHPLIIAGPTAWSKAGPQIEQSMNEAGLNYQLEMFKGHCSDEELNRLFSKANASIDIVVGVGGGQCLDTAKAIAQRLSVSVVTVSTLASTCAASSPLSIIYTPEHVFVRVEDFNRCPVLALVDPDIIRDAPVRYLTAGIGDTIVKWYEAIPLNTGKFQNAKTRAGLKMAELARDILIENSEQAIQECEKGETGESLRLVIDAVILIAGFVAGVGRHTCASSGAHSIHYGMTIIPDMKKAYHGELVAFGLLGQFKLEGKPDEEIIEMMKFYQRIHLPISLFDLGMAELREDDLRKGATKACAPEELIHRLPFPILEENVYESILDAHHLGESVKKGSMVI